MEESEWGYASVDRPLPGHEIGPHGIIRGLEEVVTCIFGPAVTYAFPDPLVTAYRYSVTHLSLISILDGTTLNWYQQEVLREQMSNTLLFGKVKDPELMIYSFRGQLQCRMGGKREGPIETYPKFWNLNPLTASGQEVLRILAWKKSFELVKRELEAILEKEVLTNKHSRVPNSEENDPGDEKLPGGPFPVRESSGRRTTEGVHRWLGSPVHRLHCSGLFSHQRYKNKFMDDSSQEDERLDAPEIRGARSLENT